VENAHRRPIGCAVTSHTALRSKPVTRLESKCYPADVRVTCLDKIFFKFPVFCRKGEASFTLVKCMGPWKLAAVGFRGWASPGAFSRSLSAQAALETRVRRLPSARELCWGGPGGAERARTCCSFQKTGLTPRTGCRFSAGMVSSLS